MEPDTNPPDTTSSWKSQRDQQWGSVKDEVYQVYMKHGNTLRKTIEVVGPKLGFTARSRTWKNKLKEWNFTKYKTAEVAEKVEKTQSRTKRKGASSPLPDAGKQLNNDTFLGISVRLGDLSHPMGFPRSTSHMSPPLRMEVDPRKAVESTLQWIQYQIRHNSSMKDSEDPEHIELLVRDEPRNEYVLLPSSDFSIEFLELNDLTREELGCLQHMRAGLRVTYFHLRRGDLQKATNELLLAEQYFRNNRSCRAFRDSPNLSEYHCLNAYLMDILAEARRQINVNSDSDWTRQNLQDTIVRIQKCLNSYDPFLVEDEMTDILSPLQEQRQPPSRQRQNGDESVMGTSDTTSSSGIGVSDIMGLRDSFFHKYD